MYITQRTYTNGTNSWCYLEHNRGSLHIFTHNTLKVMFQQHIFHWWGSSATSCSGATEVQAT